MAAKDLPGELHQQFSNLPAGTRWVIHTQKFPRRTKKGPVPHKATEPGEIDWRKKSKGMK